ncbi:hypothetical protein B0I63_003177 [Clostridium beijerinckii]|nr:MULTISPECIES: hypothetical protein [Clostridium]MBA2899704.1 hypothetical protein [Clostridium beijerinckii]NRT02729.1 hypothetical protein [Clostridium beijerinckii]NRT05103.1 hypothetical protein [Clostridium beijerinckii]NRT28751.1 hypothetical protein [Clostridium beijerinckii]NRT40895.1 hypothetical protein [Clostridium beijerinckii]
MMNGLMFVKVGTIKEVDYNIGILISTYETCGKISNLNKNVI